MNTQTKAFFCTSLLLVSLAGCKQKNSEEQPIINDEIIDKVDDGNKEPEYITFIDENGNEVELIGVTQEMADNTEPNIFKWPEEGMIKWSEVSDEFQKVAQTFTKKEKENYVSTKEECEEAFNIIVKGYPECHGYYVLSQRDIVMDMYSAARTLKLSDNPNYKQLGETTLVFVYSNVGNNGADPITAVQDVYANLLFFKDKIDGELPLPVYWTESEYVITGENKFLKDLNK